MLVDAATGHERLAVVGEDSARQDRRYTYKALEDVGGLCFENGKAVSTLGGGDSLGGGSSLYPLSAQIPDRLVLWGGQGHEGVCTCSRLAIGFDATLNRHSLVHASFLCMPLTAIG
jgi:hypothetical protein